MMPQNALSATAVQAPLVEPANSITTPLIDVEMGGAGLADVSAGLRDRLWTARYEAGEVIVSADGVPDTVLFNRPGIVELSLAFDQSMNPFVAFTDAGGSAYWWFDTQLGQQVISAYLPAGSVNLRCTMDDKRVSQLSNNDIILAYMRGGSLYYRQQRDRFGVEYLLEPAAGGQLVNVGMNVGNRLQFRLTPGV